MFSLCRRQSFFAGSQPCARAIHNTIPRLAQRLENYEIPFKDAILVIPPPPKLPPAPKPSPNSTLTPTSADGNAQDRAHKERNMGLTPVPPNSQRRQQRPDAPDAATLTPNPNLPPPRTRLFVPTPAQIAQGYFINISDYLEKHMNMLTHKLELVKAMPKPVVVLVERDLSAKDAARRDGKRIGYTRAWLKTPKVRNAANLPAIPQVGPSEGELVEIDVPEYLKRLELPKSQSKRWRLVLVTEIPRPIVEVVDREQERRKKAQEKDSKVEKKGNKINTTKEFQFTWSVAPGDIKHKIKAVRKELAKGAKCNLVFAPKDVKTSPPSSSEMETRLESLAADLGDVARSYKKIEIVRAKGVGVLFLERIP